MTEHQQHHHNRHNEITNPTKTKNINNNNEGSSSLGDLIKKTIDEESSLPFLDKLIENPVEFQLSSNVPVLEAVSDNKKNDEPVIKKEEDSMMMKDMKKKSTFCNNMMSNMGSSSSSHHEHMMMAHHGVGPMTAVGGGMSGGMIMYMDGFRFAMTGNQPCLNLYFPSWTLDTRWKFIAALICVFALSFATEAVSKFRHNLSKNTRQQRQNNNNYQARRTRQMLISGLHGFQALLGYVVMLATMTFSLEILLAVVLGLSTGYYYYFAGEIGLEGHVTTNPCCNYMQDESDEHEQRHQQQQQQQQQATLDAADSREAPPPCCNEDSDATTSLLTSDPAEV